MSDYYTGPSGQSIADLGKTIFQGGMDVADKLYQADATSQYLSAFARLRKGMSDFDAQLQMNPDWQQYGELTQENDTKLFDDISQGIKNPLAKNQFIQEATQLKASHYESAQKLAVSRWRSDMYGSTIEGVDESLNNALQAQYDKGSIVSFEKMKSHALSVASNLGGYEQYRIESLLQTATKNVYMGKLEQEAYHAADSAKNIKAGLDYISNGDNSPFLNDAERRSVGDIVKSMYAFHLDKQEKDAQAQNASILGQADDITAAGKFDYNAYSRLVAELAGTPDDILKAKDKLLSHLPSLEKHPKGEISAAQSSSNAAQAILALPPSVTSNPSHEDSQNARSMAWSGVAQKLWTPADAKLIIAQVPDPTKQLDKDRGTYVNKLVAKGQPLYGHLDLLPQVRAAVRSYLLTNPDADPATAQQAVDGIVRNALAPAISKAVDAWSSYQGIREEFTWQPSETLQTQIQNGQAAGAAEMNAGKVDLQVDSNGNINFSGLFPKGATSETQGIRSQLTALYQQQIEDFVSRYKQQIAGVRINNGWLEVYGWNGKWYRPYTYQSGLFGIEKNSKWVEYDEATKSWKDLPGTVR